MMTRGDRIQSGALVPVPIRLSPSVFERYSAEATALGKGLSTYLRERLEHQDRLESELAALRRAVERSATGPAPANGGTPSLSPGAFVEMLLHLRALVGPQKATVAQKEVERRGLETLR
jgi:predicted DNA-binding protein